MIYNMAIIDIMQAIENALRGLLGLLCIFIYDLIGTIYNLFVDISKLDILTGSDITKTLYNRVGMILGIFMVFKITFSLVQSLVDPDKLNDKNNGVVSIIKRSVIAIALLGLTPTIFREAYDLQLILTGANNSSDNIIYKIIYGSNNKNSDDFGRELAVGFYFSFFEDELEPKLYQPIDNSDAFTDYDTDALSTLSNQIINGQKTFNDTYDFLMMTVNGEYVIEFSPILCLAAGVVAVIMLISYCIQIAIRVFQLAYLQLVAPIPILSYITNPEGSFKKWINQCTSTFLDIFLRLAIIYFAMYMINEVQVIIDNMGKLPNSNKDKGWLIEIFLICGLLLFAKRVPELLKEIFPTNGSSGLSLGIKPPKEVTNFGKKAATFGAGVAIGATGAAASNLIHGGANLGRNVKKSFSEAGGWTKGNRKAALGAAFKSGAKSLGKTGLSVVGGAFGGARAGMKTKDIRKAGAAVQTANANREKRELKAEAGYHWYNPLPTIGDSIMSFAGETTGAEKKIKEAEYQQQALESSKSVLWKNAEDDVKNSNLKYDEYAFLRSLQKSKNKKGETIWRGFDSSGAVEIKDADLAARTTFGGQSYESQVRGNAKIDEKIKDQGKVIKGLQQAESDAKK